MIHIGAMSLCPEWPNTLAESSCTTWGNLDANEPRMGLGDCHKQSICIFLHHPLSSVIHGHLDGMALSPRSAGLGVTSVAKTGEVNDLTTKIR